MRIGAYICFVIAVLATISAINNIIRAAQSGQAFENFVGYVVGASLVPLIFLIGGLVLFSKSKNA